MTAAIDPKGMKGLSVNDVQERKEQYLGVLEYYLRNASVNNIVFAENSGYDLSDFRILAEKFPGKRVEFLSCNLNSYPRHLGKSYGEMLVLDYIDCQSKLVREAGGFVKVTGRFSILNIGELLAEAEKRLPWEFFCDNKDHGIYDWLHLGWTGHACDTRFFAVTQEFYEKHFQGRSGELDDSQKRLIEFMFFETAKKAAADGIAVVRRFRTEPEYAGKAGHVQTALLQVNDYSGAVAKTKRRIRQLCRRLVPCFWF